MLIQNVLPSVVVRVPTENDSMIVCNIEQYVRAIVVFTASVCSIYKLWSWREYMETIAPRCAIFIDIPILACYPDNKVRRFGLSWGLPSRRLL